MTQIPGWLLAKDAAQMLQISVSALHRLCKRGSVRSRWIGLQRLVSEPDVIARLGSKAAKKQENEARQLELLTKKQLREATRSEFAVSPELRAASRQAIKSCTEAFKK